MKLCTLRSENFGVFRQRKFDFGDDGFVLVHGPNEAGKSTLLQLLREMLFGFPNVSPYKIDGGGTMAVEAEAVLRDGRHLRFRRRKGRGATVEGTLSDEPGAIDDQRLNQLLGHASSLLYTNVFAFSLSELSSGVEGLKSAGLTGALFGGGLGGLAKLRRMQVNLKEQHESLYKSSARNPPINKLSSLLPQTKRRLQEVAVKPREYGELQEKYAKLRADLAVAQDQRRAACEEGAHFDRLMRAWEHWRQRQDAQALLEALPIPAAFQPGDAAAFDELQDRLRELQEELDTLAASQESAQRELEGLVCEAQFHERAAEIKSLAQEIGKIEGFLRDLPMRQGEYDQVLVKIDTTLKGLHRDWTRERLASLRLSLDERTRVRELARQSQTLADEIKSCLEDVAHLEGLVARQQDRLVHVTDEADLETISLMLAGQAEWKAHRDEAGRAQRKQTRLLDELKHLGDRLLATIPALPLLDSLQPPLTAAVEEFRERMAACEQRLSVARERNLQFLANQEKVQLELQNLEATGLVPDLGQLQAARQSRDDLWHLIKEHFCEKKDRRLLIKQATGEAVDKLPAAFMEQLEACDALADDCYRLANLVATKEELLRRDRLAREACEKSAVELQILTTEQQGEQTRWEQLWQACQITPQSPANMLEWMKLFESYRQKACELREAKTLQREAEEACAQYEQKLRETLQDAGTPIEIILHKARVRFDESKQAGGRRQQVELDLADQQMQLLEARQRHVQLLAEQAAWQGKWQQLLLELKLPARWEVSAIEQLLVALEQMFHDEQIAGELWKRIELMTKERDEFDVASAELAGKLAPELQPLPMVERVRQLEQRCDRAREAAAKKESLTGEWERIRAEIAAKAARRQERIDRQAAMLEAVGVATSAEYRELAQRAVRRDALAEEVRSAQRALNVAREHEPEAEFEAALLQVDLPALRERRDALQTSLTMMADAIEVQLKESGRLKAELDQLNEEGESLVLQQSIEHQRGQLREHVERWSSLVLAEKLLEDAIEKFQREHQPAVLSEARRLFEHMTQGEHVDIQHSLGDSFRVVDRQGHERRPDELSRGAREQLYLAFRLAYVRHYCQDSEPLPLIMDDVLVNFDEGRIGQTLSALYDLSRELQIIFLTCHSTTVDLVKQHCPSCHTIELTPERALLFS